MTATWKYVEDEQSSSIPAPINCRHVEYSKSPDEREPTYREKLYALFVAFGTAPLWGWVTSLLWNWFVAPPFGVPTLNLWQALGICWTISFIRTRLGTHHVSASELGARVLNYVSFPILMLAISWPLAHFILGTA